MADPALEEIAKLAAEFSEQEERLNDVSKKTAEPTLDLLARSEWLTAAERSWARRLITQIGLFTYCGALATIGLAELWSILSCPCVGGDACRHAAIADLVDLVKVSVLPVTTLIIGHYIGSHDKR